MKRQKTQHKETGSGSEPDSNMAENYQSKNLKQQ
jgi:hypothetical protein